MIFSRTLSKTKRNKEEKDTCKNKLIHGFVFYYNLDAVLIELSLSVTVRLKINRD